MNYYNFETLILTFVIGLTQHLDKRFMVSRGYVPLTLVSHITFPIGATIKVKKQQLWDRFP